MTERITNMVTMRTVSLAPAMRSLACLTRLRIFNPINTTRVSKPSVLKISRPVWNW